MGIASILINYNDEENTKKLVKKLEKFSSISKIVVVDNCSNKKNCFEKLKLLQNSKVTVIRADKNGGYNYGINYGIHFLECKNERYEILMCSNTDIDISEETIKKCIQTLTEEKDVALVAPKMMNKYGKQIRRSSWKIRTFWRDVVHSTRLLEVLFYKKLRDGEYSEQEFNQNKLEVEAISGACFFIKYEVIKKINYFDDNVFLFYEEDILGSKLKELNYKTYSLNAISFVHYESQTIGKTINYFKKMKQLFKSKMYYQKKYNHINIFQVFCFYILWIFRCIELLIEVPIRKIMKK